MLNPLAPALAALTLATPALAQSPVPLTEANISPMAVVLTDLSADDCWTDPDAARQIARDALSKTNIDLVETEDEAETVFAVVVQASRAVTGCYGYVRFAIGSMIDWKDNGEVPATLQAVSEIFEGRDSVDAFLAEGLATAIPALADYLPDS
ncbi:MAG: hypothetical protein VX874_11375 [Pseudomonadota bacterium]|nr:hypothetical protein [Pseudomonadota bacterium]